MAFFHTMGPTVPWPGTMTGQVQMWNPEAHTCGMVEYLTVLSSGTSLQFAQFSSQFNWLVGVSEVLP